jgi:hypothetical protein
VGNASNANQGPVPHGAITNRGRGISRLEGILPVKIVREKFASYEVE